MSVSVLREAKGTKLGGEVKVFHRELGEATIDERKNTQSLCGTVSGFRPPIATRTICFPKHPSFRCLFRCL